MTVFRAKRMKVRSRWLYVGFLSLDLSRLGG